jgi:peroxiredoxin
LARFAKRRDIQFTLLSDPKSKAIRAFGVLNEDFPPKSVGYGIARPVIFVVDAHGVIRGRFSESNYRERPDIDAVLNTLE